LKWDIDRSWVDGTAGCDEVDDTTPVTSEHSADQDCCELVGIPSAMTKLTAAIDKGASKPVGRRFSSEMRHTCMAQWSV
jgi:hypothetical protein